MFLKGIVTILVCTILALAASWFINHFTKFNSVDYWLSLFIFISLFFILNLFYNYKTDFKSYSNLLLATISIKLFILLITIFLYSLFNKEGLFNFFIHFSAHYILFTVFEIRYLLYIIKKRQTTHS